MRKNSSVYLTAVIKNLPIGWESNQKVIYHTTLLFDRASYTSNGNSQKLQIDFISDFPLDPFLPTASASTREASTRKTASREATPSGCGGSCGIQHSRGIRGGAGMEQEIICHKVAIPIWAIVPRGLGHIQLDILALGLKS